MLQCKMNPFRKLPMAPSFSSLRRSGSSLLRMTTQLTGQLLANAQAHLRSPGETLTRPDASVRPSSMDPGDNPGGLVLHTHIPRNLAPLAPLVVLLHGCGQDPVAFAAETGWRDLADRHGFALLMPGQTEANNPQRCFNWFRPGDVGRDKGEAGSIRTMIETVVTRHGLDRSQIFVTGLSAGGAMTACLLASYPDVFAAGAVVAGLPAGVANNVMSAMSRMGGRGTELSAAGLADCARALAPSGYTGPWPRLSIWRGEADTVVAPTNAEQIALQWTALTGLSAAEETRGTRKTWGTPTVMELWTLPGVGHVYPPQAPAEILRFFQASK